MTQSVFRYFLGCIMLASCSACSILEPELFYAQTDSCTPTLPDTTKLSSISDNPIELHMLGIAGPVSYLHLFTEVDANEVRMAGVSPLLGREFVVALDNSQCLLEGQPRFLSISEIHEISALAILVLDRVLQTPGRDEPKDVECTLQCASLSFAARCSNRKDSLTVEFYDPRLQGRYRYIAKRLQ